MAEYISKQAAVDAGYLSDWYIASVGDESPIWTDEHIDELLNDFVVIPKDTPTADVRLVISRDNCIVCGRNVRKDDVYYDVNGITICESCINTTMGVQKMDGDAK